MSESDSIIPKTPTASIVSSHLIWCLMPIGSLAIGGVFQHDCPRQPLIPIYLLVMGVLGLLLVILPHLPYSASYGNFCTAFSCLFLLFYVCWFFAGNVWVYSIYQPNYLKTSTSIETYCHKTLYLFAFWTINVHYITLGVILLYIGCIFLL